jgi:hypothetical protein
MVSIRSRPVRKVEGVLLHNSCGLHDRSADFGLIEVDGGDSLRVS